MNKVYNNKPSFHIIKVNYSFYENYGVDCIVRTDSVNYFKTVLRVTKIFDYEV